MRYLSDQPCAPHRLSTSAAAAAPELEVVTSHAPPQAGRLRPPPTVDQTSGGVLVIGGPPFGGKNLLANELSECLPNAFKLETVDNLWQPTEHWHPRGPNGQPVDRPAGKMLIAVTSLWWSCLDRKPATIVLAARFETPFIRRRACALARRVLNTRFLFVEARSSNAQTLRALSARVFNPGQLAQRIASYEQAIACYQPVGDEEADWLPCLRLSHVRNDLDEAVSRVLRHWQQQ